MSYAPTFTVFPKLRSKLAGRKSSNSNKHQLNENSASSKEVEEDSWDQMNKQFLLNEAVSYNPHHSTVNFGKLSLDQGLCYIEDRYGIRGREQVKSKPAGEEKRLRNFSTERPKQYEEDNRLSHISAEGPKPSSEEKRLTNFSTDRPRPLGEEKRLSHFSTEIRNTSHDNSYENSRGSLTCFNGDIRTVVDQNIKPRVRRSASLNVPNERIIRQCPKRNSLQAKEYGCEYNEENSIRTEGDSGFDSLVSASSKFSYESEKLCRPLSAVDQRYVDINQTTKSSERLSRRSSFENQHTCKPRSPAVPHDSKFITQIYIPASNDEDQERNSQRQTLKNRRETISGATPKVSNIYYTSNLNSNNHKDYFEQPFEKQPIDNTYDISSNNLYFQKDNFPAPPPQYRVPSRQLENSPSLLNSNYQQSTLARPESRAFSRGSTQNSNYQQSTLSRPESRSLSRGPTQTPNYQQSTLSRPDSRSFSRGPTQTPPHFQAYPQQFLPDISDSLVSTPVSTWSDFSFHEYPPEPLYSYLLPSNPPTSTLKNSSHQVTGSPSIPPSMRRAKSRYNVADAKGTSFQEKRNFRRSLPDLDKLLGEAHSAKGTSMFISFDQSMDGLNNNHQDIHHNSEPNKKNHIQPVKPSLGPERTSNQNGGTPQSPLDPPTSNNIPEETKNKPSPMAFTVDLGGGTGGSPVESNGEAAKKLDIGASISKWAPKHRRNLSLTKVEENKKVEEGVGKPPVCRPRSGTVGCVGLMTSSGRRIGGYHSEGYFSSDQDDDQANKRAQVAQELKSPRSPRTPELRSPLTPSRVVRSISHDSAKGASLRIGLQSPETESKTSDAMPRPDPNEMTLNESANFLIEKLASTPEIKRKHSSKSECEAYSPNDKKPSVSDLLSKSKEQEQKNDKMTAEVQNMTSSIQSISSCQTYDVNKEVIADDVSEAGTYTIDKDSSSPEVEQARNNIDQVFGVSATESEAEINHQRPVSTATEDNWELNVENDKYKGSTSLSRNSPNWIQQWAAQVAVHTAAPDNSIPKDGLVSPRSSKAPITSLSSSQESSDSRPRRKLPTPPAYTPNSPHTSVALTSSITSDISNQETSKKPLRDPYDKPRSPLNQTRSPLAPSRLPISQSRSPYRQQGLEYLRDSECFLRDTQNLMTSLQARVDKEKTSSNRGPSFESHDSGGDSDIDTSTSYANTDQDSRLSKALQNKLKSTKIDSLTRQIAVVTSPKRVEVKSGHHLRRERSSMSEVGYDAFVARDDQILPSDSSSETSEHAKDCRKKSDTNNPPLKFNRAFSLRRARLDDPPPQKNDKKKLARPSSAGTNSRRTPLTTSKSNQGEYGMRGSPLTINKSSQGPEYGVRGSSSQATTPKSNSSDFNRGDGGRFSLRLPRSASTTAVSKSPSRTSVKKELQHGMRKGIGMKSASTMSPKDADFQNWKRRKSYDPMKAAAEGRRKQIEKKEQHNDTQERTPSPEPLSLLRSQSFHGPEGMAANTRWTRRPNNLYGSEEEGPYSLEEEQHHHIPQVSPIRRSPTSPHQLSSPNHALSPHRQAQINAARRRGSYTLSDEGETNGTTISRKTSLDESGSEGKHSPLGSTRGGRSKAKSEALDNLVISTIHSLSVKVRTTSETLLTKLKSQYDEDGDRAALLEDVLAHLSENDQQLSATQTHSTSRELAGILRNLKKIEGALQVIDQVILSDDEQDDEDEDLEDGSHTNHWGDDY